MKPPCTITGCGKEQRARGWCPMHWARWRRFGDPLRERRRPEPTLAERFAAKVPTLAGDACQEWQGGRDDSGYGYIRVDGRRTGTHRVAWFLAHGQWPTLMVLHHCDNPPCVRIDHLYEGTNADNMRDRTVRGRASSRRGSNNGRAKISLEDVAEIRARYAAGGVLQRELADEFGLTQAHVSEIIRGEAWAS